MAETVIEIGDREEGSFEKTNVITRSEEGYQFQSADQGQSTGHSPSDRGVSDPM